MSTFYYLDVAFYVTTILRYILTAYFLIFLMLDPDTSKRITIVISGW